jgi:hypothetical protein
MDSDDSMMDTDCSFRDAKRRRQGDKNNHGDTNRGGGINGFNGQGVLGGRSPGGEFVDSCARIFVNCLSVVICD